MRFAIGAAASLAVLAVASYGLYQISRMRCFSLVGAPVCRILTVKPLIALTFDDGPTSSGLAAILPELQHRGVHATFFLIGREAERHPELVRTLLAAGQEVGNHSYTHVRMMGHRQEFYDAELSHTQAVLRAAGANPRFVRPPYGKKLIGLPLAVKHAGLTMVTWDVEDPATTDPRAFAAHVVSHAHPGAIILVHAMYPSERTGRAALPMILDGLAARGLKVVSVGELMAEAR